MTKEEFMSGVSFKMKNTNELQCTYSYVDTGFSRYILMYSSGSPLKVVYHCEVVDTEKEPNGVLINAEALGYKATILVLYDLMYSIVLEPYLSTFTVDCMMAVVIKHTKGYAVKVKDLDSGNWLPTLQIWPTLDQANADAMKKVGYKNY